MKKKLLEILKAKEEKRDALKAKGKASNDIAEVRSISEEVDSLNGEIAELRTVVDGMPDEMENPEADPDAETRSLPGGAVNVLGTYGIRSKQTPETEKRAKEMEQTLEKRGADLKNKRAVTFELDEVPELRAVTIGSGKLVAETKYSSTLNDTFNQVSSTVDLVNAVPLNGGESYEKGFVVSYGEGDYTSETGEYDESEAEFDYVSITKAKITAYTEMSDEAMKLPNINYQDLVRKNITIALRKKMAKQILAGPGGANALVGIFKAPANVIPVSSDLEIDEIDADTLDKIVLGYGGDEDIEGSGYLILNKRDLAAFAAVRSTTGEKLYKIKLNGNIGTISSSESFEVPFIINSACAALSDPATVTDTYCMAYGMMHCYEMPLFSPVTVEESRDFKFKTGQIAYRGSVWAGGNVAMYKGFIRIKKGEAV
jgi:HK97 family phage major capsid protein